MHFSNTNLRLEKSAVYFELFAQKREIGTETANILY